MKKKLFIIGTVFIIAVFVVVGSIFLKKINKEKLTLSNNEANTSINDTENSKEGSKIENVLTSTEDIKLHDVDGKSRNYSFTYKNKAYTAIYTKDNWQIKDSYTIKSRKDMAIICQALIEIHQIHGRDMVSYRTAEDMVDEWVQHNIAYNLLSEDHKWKANAKDVDFNPEDQGKSMKEMYDDRMKREK